MENPPPVIWTPAPRRDVDPTTLPLDAQQGFLLSRLDGRTDLGGLASLTGLAPERLSELLEGLVALGAVEGPAGRLLSEATPSAPELGVEVDEAPCDTHRQRFESRLHALSVDARAALARTAEEPDLSALCFDPMPQVVAALLENPRFGGMQARLVAQHHRTSAGLEALAARVAFAMDDGVRRALLRNPLLSSSLYRRLWAGQRLLAQFLVTTNRDCPEQTRAMARDLLRACFNQRTGEERVELILTTEGRCLAALAGLTVDGQTTALLCRRTYVSTLLIQNIARWSAAPPQLIAHLRRQEVVRRNAQLRQMLERHPNAS